MTTFQQPISVRTNLCTNPNSATDVAGYNFFGLSATAARNSGAGFDGANGFYSVSLSADAGANFWALYGVDGGSGVNVAPLTTYTASLYVRASRAVDAFQLNVVPWDSNGAYQGGEIYGATVALVANVWTRLSATITTRSDTSFITVRARHQSAVAGVLLNGDTLDLDGVLVEQSASLGDYFDGSTAGFTQANLANNPSFETASGTVNVRTNLITNPSFELDTASWSSGQASIIQSSNFAYTGAYSALTTITSGSDTNIATYTQTGIVSGQAYTYSAWSYVPVGSPLAGRTLNVGIEGAGATYTTLGSSSAVLVAGSWVRSWLTVTATSFGSFGFVHRYSGAFAVGATIYTDAVLLEQSFALGDYFDGSTTASGDFTYAWSGTANASSSNQVGKNLLIGDVQSYYTAALYQSANGYVGTYSAAVSLQNTSGGTPHGIIIGASTANALVSAGSTVTVSAYVKGTAGQQVQVVGRAVDVGGGYIGEGYGAYVLTFDGTWQRVSVTYAVTAQAFRPGVQITMTSAMLIGNATFYVDAVLIERGSTLQDYYAGTYAPLTQTVNAWTNFANGSTSTQTVYVTTTQTTPTTYRYLFANLVTNQILAELPLTNVSFTTVLNGAGAFSGTMLVTDATQSYLNIWGATQPARTAVYVERFSSGGSPTLVWGGIVWARDYNSTSQHVTFNASEFESYFDRRKIISVSGGTGSQIYKNADPVVIARTLIQNAETFVYNGSVAVPQSNIGVSVGSETSSATISKTYYDAELKSVLAAIQDLSHASTSGFDFKIVVAYDSSFNPTKTFKIGYPRLGTAYSATNPTAPVMEFPGNVIEYTLLEDGTLAANYIYAVGVGNGQGKLNLTSFDSGQWSAGWPLLEGATNYGDVSNQALLLNLAQGQLAAVKNPPISLKIVYPPYQDPVLGSYALGDDVRIRINDDRSGQVDDYYRIVSISVTPGENNAGERATLTLTQKGAV
jgi:hypothetical protein